MAIVSRENVPMTNVVPPKMRNRYTLRVLDATFGPSKGKQNPQMVWDCEIVEPAKITAIDGKEYLLDSLKVQYFFPIIILDEGQVNLEKTQSAQDKFLQVLKALGYAESFDPENMQPEQYNGLVFDAILDSTEDIPQKPNGKGGWEPITGADGKPISKGWKIQINTFAPAYDILCRSTVETNRAF